MRCLRGDRLTSRTQIRRSFESTPINCMPFGAIQSRFPINSNDSARCDDKWRCRPQCTLHCSMCFISILNDEFSKDKKSKWRRERHGRETERDREGRMREKEEKNAPHPNHFTIMANLSLCVCVSECVRAYCVRNFEMAKMTMISDVLTAILEFYPCSFQTHTYSDEHTKWLSTSRPNLI